MRLFNEYTPLTEILAFYKSLTKKERERRQEYFRKHGHKLPILTEAPTSYLEDPDRWSNYGAEEWKEKINIGY
jgi:hypothetical protein